MIKNNIIKVIELSEIDELLENYKAMKREDESFKEFIECTKEDKEDRPERVFIWKAIHENKLIEVSESEEETINNGEPTHELRIIELEDKIVRENWSGIYENFSTEEMEEYDKLMGFNDE